MKTVLERLEKPDGVDEVSWAKELGLSVPEWRDQLEKARRIQEAKEALERGEDAVVEPAVGVGTELALLSRGEGVAEAIGQAVASGARLKELAEVYGVSAGALRAWIFSDAERLALYEGGLKARAEELADEAMDFRDQAIRITDEDWDKEDVPLAKLRMDSRFKAAQINMGLAEKYDPRRFGQDRSMKLEVQGKSEGELLEQLKELTRQPEMREVLKTLLSDGAKVIEGESVNG